MMMHAAHAYFKVLEGHHLRGTTLREALRGNLPLRGFSGPLLGPGVRSRAVRGSPRGSAGVCGGPRDFPRVVTLSCDAGELLEHKHPTVKYVRICNEVSNSQTA